MNYLKNLSALESGQQRVGQLVQVTQPYYDAEDGEDVDADDDGGREEAVEVHRLLAGQGQLGKLEEAYEGGEGAEGHDGDLRDAVHEVQLLGLVHVALHHVEDDEDDYAAD